ncbi:MAG: hypothetical protein ACR2ND_09590 [Solirubrobacteraceae bacterium]
MTPIPKAATTFVTCIALAALGAGCGGSSNNFKSDVQRQLTDLSRLEMDIGNVLQGASGKNNSQLEVAFSGLAQRAGSQVGQLAKLKPDPKSASSLAALQSDLAKVEQDLGGIAASARANSAAAAKSATETLIADATALKATSDTLKSNLASKGG